MTPDELRRILEDKEPLDPWLVSNFFQPLKILLETAGIRYQIATPPQRYLEARDFAIGLWECNNDDDLRMLCSRSLEGATQLAYLISVFALQRQLLPEVRYEGIEPTSRKPFAALASRALQWLDEVEAKAPGKTQPLD